MAWAGCCPGRAFISVRFLTQPVIPEENFPPVIAAMSGAPPVTQENTHVIKKKKKKTVINILKTEPEDGLKNMFFSDTTLNK